MSGPALWLADEFFLAAHRDYDGRPRLNDQAMNLGLAAALLGELVLHRSIRVAPPSGELTVVDAAPPPDATAHAVLDQLVAEPGITSASAWLRFLARSAYQDVADRLVRTNRVRPRPRGALWRKGTAYPPTDPNDAVYPGVRITRRIARGEPLTAPDVLLLGLSVATGLDRQLLADLTGAARREVPGLLDRLPPALSVLIAVTNHEVGQAVLNHRR